MDRHRAIVAPKFASVIATFERELAGTGVATWSAPKGGYFITLDVLDGCAAHVIGLAKAAGVALTPAGSTYPHGRDPLRLPQGDLAGKRKPGKFGVHDPILSVAPTGIRAWISPSWSPWRLPGIFGGQSDGDGGRFPP